MEVKIGNSVKLNINNKEKIWVEVKEIDGGKYKGKVDQHPRLIDNIFFGDTVEFTEENIIDYF
jgi:uncharacterized protein YegJ (DUF2314 family)